MKRKHKLTYKCQVLLRCIDDSMNDAIGSIEDWVNQGQCYWGQDFQKSGIYDDLILDLYDNNQEKVIASPEFTKWKARRFEPVAEPVCLN